MDVTTLLTHTLALADFVPRLAEVTAAWSRYGTFSITAKKLVPGQDEPAAIMWRVEGTGLYVGEVWGERTDLLKVTPAKVTGAVDELFKAAIQASRTIKRVEGGVLIT